MVVIEKGQTSFGAYVPDIPGCIAVSNTEQEVLLLIQEAIDFHLQGIKEEVNDQSHDSLKQKLIL